MPREGFPRKRLPGGKVAADLPAAWATGRAPFAYSSLPSTCMANGTVVSTPMSMSAAPAARC